MARQFQSGFEFNNTSTNQEWGANTGSPAIAALAARTGGFGLRIQTLSSATVKGLRTNVTSAGSTTASLYCRCYIQVISLPGPTGSTFMSLATRSGFVTPIAYVRLLQSGALELLDEDSSIGTSVTQLTADGLFHLIELHYDASGAGGTDIVELKIDGGETITRSNADLAASGAAFCVGGNLAAEANTAGEWYIDDCACNDNSGTDQLGYCGAGKIVLMIVTGDGDATNRGVQGTDWETGPSAGGTAYQMVDEGIPPNDPTDYIALLTTSTGPTDPPVLLFGMESGTSKGIASGDTINVVAVRARQGQIDGTGRNGVILLKSGSSFTQSASLSFSGTTWSWDDASVGFNPWSRCVAYKDPDTSAPWTLAALDSVQAGFRAGSDVTPNPWFTVVLLDVDFTPSSGPTAAQQIAAIQQAQSGCIIGRVDA